MEIPHTPKHGSWLNAAEIEPSVHSCQRLGHRIGPRKELEREVAAREAARNEAGVGVR